MQSSSLIPKVLFLLRNPVHISPTTACHPKKRRLQTLHPTQCRFTIFEILSPSLAMNTLSNLSPLMPVPANETPVHTASRKLINSRRLSNLCLGLDRSSYSLQTAVCKSCRLKVQDTEDRAHKLHNRRHRPELPCPAHTSFVLKSNPLPLPTQRRLLPHSPLL